jgi:GWxTD domain-containing protein
MFRRISLCLPLLLLSTVCLAASPSLPQLFQKAKQQFRLVAYSDALKTLDEMARLAAAPENERYRTSMTPALAFYRGACLAALGRSQESHAEFQVYLTFEPNAQLDPSQYPKSVVAALDEARRDLKAKKELPAEGGSIATSYRGFRHDPSEVGPELGEDWADGPVRFLLTAQERQNFTRLSDPVTRSEFVTAFWKERDPRPETPENELRDEFERRVAFADSHFAQDEARGSLTDRGMVFVLLGPPTYAGRQPIRTGEDSSDPSGMVKYTHNDITQVQKIGGPSAATNVAINNMTGPSNTLPESSMQWREVWHYRRELLPKGVPYQQVDLEFITRKGYGKNVLQRDSAALNTIEIARKDLRRSATARNASR